MTDDFESRLRASLRRHAQDAPDGDRLAERIVHAADAPTSRRRVRDARWRTWTLPLAAAGAVAAIAATLVGVSQVHHSAAPPAGTEQPTTSTVPTAVTPSVTSSAPAPTTAPEIVPADLHQVRVVDATFVGPSDGWLLVSSDCIGKPGTCTAMLRTTDGGTHWISMPNPPVNVPGVGDCADPCVDHLRFANERTGYAYGTSAFYMTTDGGASWSGQSGGAVALESLDNNVIRVSTTEPGCGPPGCGYQVQAAAIGSSAWSSPHRLSANGMTTGAQLVRGGDHDAYVLVTGHTAGGAQSAVSTLFRSSDDGASWQRVGEPCPQVGGEVDSVSIAAGGGDRVSVLCVTRQAPQHAFVAVSTDAGAHFARAGGLPWPGVQALVGDPDTVLLATGGSRVYRSGDGGQSWQRVPGFTGTVSWAGFESRTVGRVVGANGNTIWTTRDAGEHWTPFTLG